jgi:hypothetical protein
VRSSAPTGDSGNAVERLQDEQWHILELFDTYVRYQRDPDQRLTEATRLATLIYTLLRVHCELELMLLHPALAQEPGIRPLLAKATERRNAMLDALERAEALSPRDPAHVQEMARLAQRVRAWFQEDEEGIFESLRSSHIDLQALDREMAARQEALLSAGRNAARMPSSGPLGPAVN